MTYEDSLQYLTQLGKFGINLGLTRIERLLELMGNPERCFKPIHVTGTNGKGSTTVMLASILQASGIRTGMYTSPHLNEYTERIVVNGQEISETKFSEAISYTAQFVTKMAEQGWEHPTEFEVLTAAAFYYFAAADVEYAIIEVGLGGLLDSTNVINPEVAVITNVALEHTDRCGSTIAEIAAHKAGIIKNAVPVVTAAQHDAFTVINTKALGTRSDVYLLGRDFKATFAGLAGLQQKVSFELVDDPDGPKQVTANLIGSHQAENCALAIMTAILIGKKDKRISWEQIVKGVAAAKWPGRFEIFSGRPMVVIDGAHNPAGAIRLRDNLDLVFAGKEIVFLLGILKDKDVCGIVNSLIRPNDKVVVAAPLSDRAGEPSEVAKLIKANVVSTAENIEEGLRLAKVLAGSDGIICIAGSLYLIGAARAIIVGGQKIGC
ncbi:MAG: bifunctional folylpolyglutamate synthase/dihydrofolate synthase [Veillonellaceae bacterium]|nr:bifunctional folylpolyglutamate synthase/dihydrofolate synthase [Veillonellaceae bacterium]